MTNRNGRLLLPDIHLCVEAKRILIQETVAKAYLVAEANMVIIERIVPERTQIKATRNNKRIERSLQIETSRECILRFVAKRGSIDNIQGPVSWQNNIH